MNSLGLLVVVLLGDAYAPYVRSKTSDHCLWWPDKTITFTQNTVGNSLTGPNAFSAVTTSFATWQVAMTQCGSLTLTEGPRSTSRKIGTATGDAKNENLVLFRASSCTKKVAASNACWADGSCGNQFDCWDHASALLGITTVSYNTTNGRMFDADIELNAADNVFTAVDSPVCTVKASATCVATDVQNTVTHEIGHLLGLDHTKFANSTMNATASIGETSKRSLDTGTKSFVCSVYEKDLPPLDCVLEPVSEDLGKPVHGCATSPGGPVGLVLLALIFGLRKKSAVGLLLVAGAAQASTVTALNLDQLISTSDVVVRARVSGVSAHWSGDHSRIVTDISLSVTETWKGVGFSEIIAMQPGGEVGSVGQRIEGVPHFTQGEEVVMFLEARGTRFVITGFSQGKFEVTGASVRPTQTSANLIDGFTGATVQPSLEAMSVDALKRYVVGSVSDVPSPLLRVP